MDIITQVRQKREFSLLPESVIGRVLNHIDSSLSDKDRVREVRSLLRKYFGVFLTNRVVKPKDVMDYDAVLSSHKSSSARDYSVLYSRIFDCIGNVDSVLDVGCGVNGFSYPFLKSFWGNVAYLGLEASGQLVDSMNLFFKNSEFGGACAECADVFITEKVVSCLESLSGTRCVFLFQVLDALEGEERGHSSELITALTSRCDFIVVSMPLSASLSGKRLTKVRRNWVFDMLSERVAVTHDFELFGERFFVCDCR